MSDLRWKTAITKVEPNKILLRGYRLDELIGRISYGDAIYLALKGELPPGNEGKVIEAILVSVIDHGGSPPSTLAARTIASTGAELSAAVAGGILAISQYHGGAIEECMNILSEGVAYQHETSAALEDAAEWVVKRYHDCGKRIPGFGHRLHTRDPRTARLFELAATWGVAGRFVAMAWAIERALSERLQRPMPINADGAIAALLCELHFEPALADAFFMMARIPGLVAHIHEERSRQKPMRRIHPTDIEYDGPEERPWTGERVE